uniref:RRM domain-containing protein n=1 Tax=Daphnia galeata TaxID=27404 RepID=A0A8J2RHW0_9CRUS|nr:unnamed protein product [Daphnia galeata]
MDNMDAHSQSQHGDNTTEVPNDPGKMFIGGLSWQTSAEGLREYFSKFGDVTEVMVMKDPTTRRSRGFGFVTFADAASVDKVLASAPHELDGKKIDPKVAFPRRAHPKMVTRTKKIFVGGLSAPSTVDDVKGYFEQFGRVEDAMLMFDKQTNRHRGFAFVTFESEDVVDKVCEIHFHEINNKMVECKKAQPKEVMLPVNAARGRAATLRAGYGELLLLSAAAACSASAGNAAAAAAASSSLPASVAAAAAAAGSGGGAGALVAAAGLGQLVVPSLSSPAAAALHHHHHHHHPNHSQSAAMAMNSHLMNNPNSAMTSAALQQLQQHHHHQQHQHNQSVNNSTSNHHHHRAQGGGGGGQSPGKAAGLSAAAAALLGNGLVSYRYAPYPIPASSAAHNSNNSLSNVQAAAQVQAQVQQQQQQQQQQQAVAAQAAANEALAASMAGLAGHHHLPALHPGHNFTGLYAHPLFAAAAAAGHHHHQATMQDMMAAHHQHAVAVQAAVNKQRVVQQQQQHGFLNNNNNNNTNAGGGGGGGSGGSASLAELNLSSFAGLEGFYPVPVDLVWSLGALQEGLPAAYAAAYAGRGYPGYASFGLPYPAGQPTPQGGPGGATYYDYTGGAGGGHVGGAAGPAAFHPRHHHHHHLHDHHNPHHQAAAANMGNSPLLRDAYTGRSAMISSYPQSYVQQSQGRTFPPSLAAGLGHGGHHNPNASPGPAGDGGLYDGSLPGYTAAAVAAAAAAAGSHQTALARGTLIPTHYTNGYH